MQHPDLSEYIATNERRNFSMHETEKKRTHWETRWVDGASDDGQQRGVRVADATKERGEAEKRRRGGALMDEEGEVAIGGDVGEQIDKEWPNGS